MRKAAAHITALVVFFSAVPAFAETSVAARFDPEVVEPGQRFDYIIEIVSDASSGIAFEAPPDFGELDMLGSGKRSSFRPGTGAAARQLTMNFTLRASKTGTFTVTPPVVKVGDRTFRLPERDVEVVPKGKAPRARPKADSRYAIDATVTPDRDPYVGEQITVNYVLLRDAQSPRVQPAPPDEPSLDDFWIEDLTDGTGFRRRSVMHEGKVYEQVSLRLYGLFPLKAGPAVIEPMSVALNMGGLFQRPQTITVDSDPIRLNIKPLPPNAPEGFNESNVGSWTFEARVDHRATKVGRAITLELVVDGEGHIDRIVLPKIEDIPGARVTHTDEKVRRHRGSQQIGGRKTLRVSLMPTEEGTLTIPALQFHYFDPNDGTYKTAKSRPLDVKVAPGVLPEQTVQKRVAARANTDGADVVAGLADALLPPRRRTPEPEPQSPLSSWWFYLLALLPVIGLLGLAIERPTRRFRAARSPALAREAALIRAREAVGDARTNDELYEILRAFVAARFNVSPGLVTADEIEQKLVQAGVTEPLATDVALYLGNLEARRFGGGDSTVSSGDTTTLLELLEQLDHSSTADPKLAAGVVLIALMFLTFNAQATPDAQVQWDSGDAPGAATTWAKAAAAQPRSATLAYNTGTAFAHAEYFGEARLYLERAALLAPFDSDVSSQLDTVRRIVRLRAIESSRTGKTLDGDEPLFWWRLGSYMWPPLVAGAILIGLWVALAAALVRRFHKHAAVRDAAFVIMLAGGAFAAIGMATACIRTVALNNVDPAVLLDEDFVVRDGPSDHARVLSVPDSAIPGTVLRIVEERGRWTKVALPGELEGWTTHDAVEPIVRRPPE